MEPDRSEHLRRRGIRLEWATNAWNVAEVFITITLGFIAGSLALVAFGLDSVTEIFASTIVILNLRDTRSDPGDRRIHQALRSISVAFWLLAAFLLALSIRSLLLGLRPGESPLGIAWLAATALVMFGLAAAKRITARQSGSETLAAEASMTFLDGCLSTGILAALVLNTTLGWWWTDASAAIVVAGFAVAEGVHNWRDSAPHTSPDQTRPR